MLEGDSQKRFGFQTGGVVALVAEGGWDGGWQSISDPVYGGPNEGPLNGHDPLAMVPSGLAPNAAHLLLFLLFSDFFPGSECRLPEFPLLVVILLLPGRVAVCSSDARQ